MLDAVPPHDPEHRRRLSTWLIAAAPVIDLALLVFTVLHLRSGAEAQRADGLTAVYLGVTVAFGHRLLCWADGHFAHRFGGGPPPARPPRYGAAHARHERHLWYAHLLAYVIGCALLLAGVGVVGDASRSGALIGWIPGWGLIVAIDFVWSFSYSLWPR
jgi:hypothetical protein